MNRRTPVVCVPALVLGLALSVDVSYAANQPPVARFTVTPGSGTVETRTAMADLAVRNVAAVLSGQPPLTPVS